MNKETSITSRLKVSGRNSARDSYCFDSSRLGDNSNKNLRKNSDNFDTPGNDNLIKARTSLPSSF